MIDVVRNRWMPPTAAQKKSDRDYLDAGGQLEVIASEPSSSKSLRPTWIRRGPLLVSLDQMTWSTKHHEDETFTSDDWEMLPNPGPSERQLAQITLVSKRDTRVRRHLRVPVPDIELLHWAMDSDHRGGHAT
jgi:hypothetical protein